MFDLCGSFPFYQTAQGFTNQKKLFVNEYNNIALEALKLHLQVWKAIALTNHSS
jgi:hypothetical protein